jgi:hypothetical protein
VLQLNRGIATTDAKSEVLERTNSTLRERVATLNSAERIQRLAEQRGYVLPAPGDVTYLRPKTASDARLAAQRIVQPTADSPQPAATAPATPVTPTAAVTPAAPAASATPVTTTPTTTPAP